MKLPASLYSAKRVVQPRPHAVRREDLFVYEAIVGKTAQLPPTPAAPAPGEPVKAFASRTRTPNLTQIRNRLQEMCEQSITSSVRRPQMADWLRHLSDEAFKRLEQAQARLRTARPGPMCRRVISREVQPPLQIRKDFKRVA